MVWLGFSDGDRLDSDGGVGAILTVGGGAGDGIKHIFAGGEFAKDGIAGGEAVVLVHDKELAAIGVGASIGHGQRAPVVGTFDRLIVKFVSWPASTRASGIPSLDHEA